jgi:hypothetical protein
MEMCYMCKDNDKNNRSYLLFASCYTKHQCFYNNCKKVLLPHFKGLQLPQSQKSLQTSTCT